MNVITCQIGLKGFLKFEAINKFSGHKRILADWFPNTVLDSGRNEIAKRGQWASDGSYCQVGTDSTPSDVSQTALLGWVAGTNTQEAHTFGAQGSAPYYGWDRYTYRFAAGDTAANLNEAGVGWAVDGATLLTRARIIDGAGDPTTVTPLADEILDVTYELRYYAPTADVDDTITLDGIDYDTKTRASQVNDETYWASHIGEQMTVSLGDPDPFDAYDGAIGTTIQSPDGSNVDIDGTPFASAYSNNSYELDINANCGINGWLPPSDIRCIVCTTKAGRFQTQFTATSGGDIGGPIPKTNLQTMSLTWRLAWIEATIP
jgi:hypothetical protein